MSGMSVLFFPEHYAQIETPGIEIVTTALYMTSQIISRKGNLNLRINLVFSELPRLTSLRAIGGVDDPPRSDELSDLQFQIAQRHRPHLKRSSQQWAIASSKPATGYIFVTRIYVVNCPSYINDGSVHVLGRAVRVETTRPIVTLHGCSSMVAVPVSNPSLLLRDVRPERRACPCPARRPTVYDVRLGTLMSSEDIQQLADGQPMRPIDDAYADDVGTSLETFGDVDASTETRAFVCDYLGSIPTAAAIPTTAESPSATPTSAQPHADASAHSPPPTYMTMITDVMVRASDLVRSDPQLCAWRPLLRRCQKWIRDVLRNPRLHTWHFAKHTTLIVIGIFGENWILVPARCVRCGDEVYDPRHGICTLCQWMSQVDEPLIRERPHFFLLPFALATLHSMPLATTTP